MYLLNVLWWSVNFFVYLLWLEGVQLVLACRQNLCEGPHILVVSLRCAWQSCLHTILAHSKLVPGVPISFCSVLHIPWQGIYFFLHLDDHLLDLFKLILYLVHHTFLLSCDHFGIIGSFLIQECLALKRIALSVFTLYQVD